MCGSVGDRRAGMTVGTIALVFLLSLSQSASECRATGESANDETNNRQQGEKIRREECHSTKGYLKELLTGHAYLLEPPVLPPAVRIG